MTQFDDEVMKFSASFGRALAYHYFCSRNLPGMRFDWRQVVLLSIDSVTEVELEAADFACLSNQRNEDSHLCNNFIRKYKIIVNGTQTYENVAIDRPFSLGLLTSLQQCKIIEDVDLTIEHFKRELEKLMEPWEHLNKVVIVVAGNESISEAIAEAIAKSSESAIARAKAVKNLLDEESVEACHSLGDNNLSTLGSDLAAIFFHGELLHLLPGIEKRVARQNKCSVLFSKMVIACPRDERAVKIFDSELMHFGVIGSELEDGSRVRYSFQTDVYQIDDVQNKPHRVMLCIPAPLRTILMMNNQGKLSDRECNAQIDSFIQTLKDGLLAYKELENTYVILQCKDATDLKSLQNSILRSIDQSLVNEASNDDPDDICIDGDQSEAELDFDALKPTKSWISCPLKPGRLEDHFFVCNDKLILRSTSSTEAAHAEDEEQYNLLTVIEAAKQSGLVRDPAYSRLKAYDLADSVRSKLVLQLLSVSLQHSQTHFEKFLKSLAEFQRSQQNKQWADDSGEESKNDDAEMISARPLDADAKCGSQTNASMKGDDDIVKNLQPPGMTGVDSSNLSEAGSSVDDSINVNQSKVQDLKATGGLVSKPDEHKIKVTTSVLFGMLEDQTQLPYDFEKLLRKLIFDHKVDVSSLRNSTGMTLLHSAVLNSRAPFILPFFRAGCWKNLRTLTVEVGKRFPYEGRTADEICATLRSRKVQKELDTYTMWEKSLNMIHITARSGNLAEVKRYLEFAQDLHKELDGMDCSTLYWAVVGGNLEIVQLLLDLGVDHEKVNARNETLLHVCCMLGHRHLIEKLVVDLKMDLVAKDSTKKSALLRVAENGDTQCLERLIECGMRRELLGSMLAIAGHYGRIAFIRFVVENYGVDPQSKDEAGKSAYLRAAEQGRMDVLKYMFTKKLNFEENDVRRRNVLHLAADGADASVMEYLIAELTKRNVKILDLINARDKYIGGELCMLIRGKDKGRESWHYVEVVRGLFDIFMKRTRGGTIDVAKYGTLLNSGWGADPDEAAARDIEKRFEMRRNVQTNDDLDVTPLHIAAFKDKYDVAKILVEAGTDLNTRDKFGLTPLHIAAMRGNMDLVKLLLRSGANPNRLDTMIKTPSDVAEDNEHREICNYIKGLNVIPMVEDFRDSILPNVQRLLSASHVQSLHDGGQDVRAHMIATLRDMTVSINEVLLALGSGPVLEESSHPPRT